MLRASSGEGTESAEEQGHRQGPCPVFQRAVCKPSRWWAKILKERGRKASHFKGKITQSHVNTYKSLDSPQRSSPLKHFEPKPRNRT